tara:strand:- start:59 stop:874 length:816 start_codon:yes stop_codon:yes gene_type:complete
MILWISSFPKSGNTWLRSLITSYLDKDKKKSVFEKIKEIERFPSVSHFEGILNFDELKNNQFKICKHWIDAQEKINLSKTFKILKTHNFCGEYEGNWFTNSDNTCGFIYIVRDPRSVAVSYAHHIGISFEKSVEIICNRNQYEDNEKNLIEIRSSWKVHYLSWKRRDYPKLIIKYEDLLSNTFEIFSKVLNFLNEFKKIEINKNEIKETIEKCSFDNLSKLEKSKGFIEKKGNENFFRKGLTNEWKTVLKKDLVNKIENEFFEEMKELKYL